VPRPIFPWGNCRRSDRAPRTSVSRWLLALPALLLVPLAVAAPARQVLVLYSNSRLLPANIAFDSGLRQVVDANHGQPVQILAEFLDEPEFSGDRYEVTVSTYLREKYADRPLDAVLTGGPEALSFMLRYRDRLFPRVPIVHAAVMASTLRLMSTLPSDVVGVPVDYDFAGTVQQALKWHPRATRLIIANGASKEDAWDPEMRAQITPVLGHVQAEYLDGLPLPVLLKRLGQLGSDSVVLTMGLFQDGDGRTYVPRDTAVLIAAASSAPVYSPDEYVGTGVVGGKLRSYEQMGRQSGQILERLLRGESDWRRLPPAATSVLHVDWRQVERWGIDPKQIPPDAVVHFRPPTLWQAHRNAALGALIIILLLSCLVAWLLLERRRRRIAEIAVQKQHFALAHAMRLAVAGELTAAIAHELNQPLCAVQLNADVADLILLAQTDRNESLIGIVTDIRRDTLRASEVIRRLRTLLAKREPERRLFDVSMAITDVALILRAEGERREITFNVRSSFTPAVIKGDQTQIEQVLINLVLNAMDAVADLPAHRRIVEVSMRRDLSNILMTVRDLGHGISIENLPKLFDSFFTTKQRGMGLGLAIARSVIESHGGRIWAENREPNGATFNIELPASEAGRLQ
jgi:signal transduction histidine kinase